MRPTIHNLRAPAQLACGLLLLGLFVTGLPAFGAPPIKVTSAVPDTGEQGTLSLVVRIAGDNFGNDSKVAFYVTGTSDPGGIVVKNVHWVNAKALDATIDIAADAQTALKFDVQVLSNGRTGKGTELFTVRVKTAGTDTIPPGEVHDLAAVEVGFSSAAFTWTAPADDGYAPSSGPADRYDFRLSTSGPFTEGNWDYSYRIQIYPQPGAPGSVEWHAEYELTPETTYWAAVRTADETGGNTPVWTGAQGWSGISNQWELTTLSCPPTPTWLVEQVAPSCEPGVRTSFPSSSLDFDADGRPGILYQRRCDAEYGGLVLVRWTGAAWVSEPVPIAFSGGYDSAILCFDPVTGAANIASSRGGPGGNKGVLTFYRQAAGGWQGEEIDTAAALAFLAYGPSGPVLVYRVTPRRQPAVLRLAEWTGSGWSRHDLPAVLPGIQGDLEAFAFDGLGNLALLYALDPGDGTRSLVFALRDGSAWRQEIVDTRIGFWSHLAWDPERGKFAALYEPAFDGNSSGLNRFYLSREPLTVGTAWNRELVLEAHWAWADGFVYDTAGTASLLFMFDDKTLALTSRGPDDPAWGTREILECEAGGGRMRLDPLTGDLALLFGRSKETGEWSLYFARRLP